MASESEIWRRQPEPVTIKREADGSQVLVGEAPEWAVFSSEFVESLPLLSRHGDQIGVFLTRVNLFYRIAAVEPAYYEGTGDRLVAELIAIQDL